MTVSTTTNKIVLTADGLTNTFTFSFAVPSGAPSDILVYETSTTGTITQLTYSTQYTVTLNSAVAPNPTPVGGSVNIPSTPSNGTLITILRSMSEVQATSLANQGTLYQPVVEAMVDYTTMLAQQITELQGRSIAVAVSDSAPTALPPAAQRANLVMGFDSSGNPTAVSQAPAGTISSAMAPFVGAASIAAAKALLGYGTMANENIGAAGKGIVDDGSGNALVKHTVTAVAAGQSPTSANHMTDYVCSGSLVHTLPKLTTVFNGYELWFFCITNTSTLSPNAADNFPTKGGGISIVLTAGQCARLVGDGVSAWQIFLGKIPNIGGRTKTVFTSGTAATYSVPAGCTGILVRMIGAGGGGGGSGGAGGTGGDTIFNGIHASGGPGGASVIVGGSGQTNGAGSASLRILGGAGNTGFNGGGGGTPITTGGAGAASPFGSGGPAGSSGAGVIGVSPGSGGGGFGGGAGTSSGGGGQAGEYVELIINNPAASYVYTVGTGGTAGTGTAGGAGAPGIIIIDELYGAS